MAENPGFPGEGFDFGYAEAGADLAGLVVRDASGLVRSGVMPSKANLITGRSDWNVDVAPFVVVRGDGPRVLLGSVDASIQAAIAPAPASNSRIDLVWALARNVGAGDIAGCVHVVTGVPGPIPVKPSLPAGGVELGTVTVPATATGTSSATIANTFKQTCAAGGVLPFRDASDRDGFAAVDGQMGLVGGVLYVYSSGAWVRIGPRSAGGRVDGSTNITGRVTVTHGMGVTPSAATVNISTTSPVIPTRLKALVGSFTATTFEVQIVRNDTGDGPFAENPVIFYWTATT